MKFNDPLYEGQFVKRYKRFFSDILTPDGETITAHCPNTGSMKGLLIEDSPCRYTFKNDPKRILKHTLQAIKTPPSWVGVNTHLANQLVYEAFENKVIPHWNKYSFLKKEVKINAQTRIDLMLWNAQGGLADIKKWDINLMKNHQFHFVEIKNVTLVSETNPHQAQFPDAVTTRGQKHLTELIELINQGHTAEIFYLIQREDCDSFSPADHIDPTYGQLLREAADKGVQVSAYQTQFSPQSITVIPNKIKIHLN